MVLIFRGFGRCLPLTSKIFFISYLLSFSRISENITPSEGDCNAFLTSTTSRQLSVMRVSFSYKRTHLLYNTILIELVLPVIPSNSSIVSLQTLCSVIDCRVIAAAMTFYDINFSKFTYSFIAKKICWTNLLVYGIKTEPLINLKQSKNEELFTFGRNGNYIIFLWRVSVVIVIIMPHSCSFFYSSAASKFQNFSIHHFLTISRESFCLFYTYFVIFYGSNYISIYAIALGRVCTICPLQTTYTTYTCIYMITSKNFW